MCITEKALMNAHLGPAIVSLITFHEILCPFCLYFLVVCIIMVRVGIFRTFQRSVLFFFVSLFRSFSLGKPGKGGDLSPDVASPVPY